MVIWTLPAGATLPRTQAVAKAVEHHYLGDREEERRRRCSRCRGSASSASARTPAWRSSSSRTGTSAPARTTPPRRSRSRATGMLSGRARRVGLLAHAAGDPGPRPVARASTSQLQATPGTDRAQLAAAARPAARHGARRIKKLVGGAPRRSRRDAAAQDRHRSGEGGRARRCRRTTSRPRSPRRGAACTSTTSSIAAASSACSCRATRRSARSPRISRAGTCAARPGSMTPFAAFATTRWTFGAETLSRYNGLASYDIQGMARAGHELRRARWTRSRSSPNAAAAGHDARVERPVVPGARSRAARPLTLYAISILRRSSCASRRSTRAGRCRSRCCS